MVIMWVSVCGGIGALLVIAGALIAGNVVRRPGRTGSSPFPSYLLLCN